MCEPSEVCNENRIIYSVIRQLRHLVGVGDGITVMYSFVHIMQDMYTCENFKVNVTEDFSRLFKQIQDSY